jgi:hypothetical protein
MEKTKPRLEFLNEKEIRPGVLHSFSCVEKILEQVYFDHKM